MIQFSSPSTYTITPVYSARAKNWPLMSRDLGVLPPISVSPGCLDTKTPLNSPSALLTAVTWNSMSPWGEAREEGGGEAEG